MFALWEWVAVVRLLKVTNANPLPPSEVLQSRVTLLGLGSCARALDPGEEKNVAANAVTTNIVGRFIEFAAPRLCFETCAIAPAAWQCSPQSFAPHYPVRGFEGAQERLMF